MKKICAIALSVFIITLLVFLNKGKNKGIESEYFAFPSGSGITPNLSYCIKLLNRSVLSHPGKNRYLLFWQGTNSPFVVYDKSNKSVSFLGGGKGHICVEVTMSKVTDRIIRLASNGGDEKDFRRLGCQVISKEVGGLCE